MIASTVGLSRETNLEKMQSISKFHLSEINITALDIKYKFVKIS
jgi:hypothetical protein